MESRKSKDQSTTSRSPNPFDTMEGYSGQDYHRDREAELARQHPSGEKLVQGGPAVPREESLDGPAEAEQPPAFYPQSGNVRGG